MTPQQFIGTAVRLFAIWLAITGMTYFSSIFLILITPPEGFGSGIAIAAAFGSIIILVALLLWFFPMVVAQKLIPRTQYTNHLSFHAQELARVGCALLGLWLLSRSSPSLIWFLLRRFLFVDNNDPSAALFFTPEVRFDVVVCFFEQIFAIVVIVKAGAFARFVSPESRVENEKPPI